MKILYITSAPITTTSSANICNIAIIKGFLALGHDVTVLCAHSDSLVNEEILISLGIERASIVPIRYSRPSITVNNNNIKSKRKISAKNVVRKIYHSFSIFDHYKILAKRLSELNVFEEYFDLMITSSDPRSVHLLGEWIQKHKRNSYGKWMQLYGDPILLDISTQLKLPKSYIRYIEKKLIRMADKVLYVSPLTLIEQKKIYPSYSDKMHFISIPYIKEKIFDNKKIINSKIKIGYFGDYNPNIRNLKPLYDGVNKMKNLQLFLYGNSSSPFDSTTNVTVKSRVPFNELEEIEKQVDILIGVCNLKGTQVPAKLYYYAATNKPVIFIIDGNEQNKQFLSEYITSFNRFIVCENNIESIEDTIMNFEELNKTVNNSPIEKLNFINVAKEICNIL
ncbi:hypothetical protein [Peribacillus frigoritolerans]|uniref:hypothetical protein n=1 Tax=Peribacillus frigoritolerans TaxID=450367 RepID=UPI0007BF295E|nr:hypothetical protein [Peribacillus frigoritolerans]